ncbi:hypothetical protein ACRRTK_024901 [Alexandromys fortis]
MKATDSPNASPCRAHRLSHVRRMTRRTTGARQQSTSLLSTCETQTPCSSVVSDEVTRTRDSWNQKGWPNPFSPTCSRDANYATSR